MWIEVLIWVLRVVLVINCALMVLIILMQRSKQEGLGAAFGAGMTDSVFGSQTSNVLSRMTTWCAIIFFGCTMAYTYLISHKEHSQTHIRKALTQPDKPAPVPVALPNTTTSPAPVSEQTKAAPASPQKTEAKAEKKTDPQNKQQKAKAESQKAAKPEKKQGE